MGALGARSALAALAALAACASGAGAPSPSAPPPSWWTQPPPSREVLYFVGDATGAGDEGMARDLAYTKALTQLTTYLGATVATDFSSREGARDGVESQEVELQVTVSGQPRTLRRVRLDRVETRAGAGGYDGYALVAWPRAEYEATLAAERNQAQAALTAYVEAERATDARDFDTAQRALENARTALGPPATPIALDHATLKDTGLLRGAIDALAKRIAAESAAAAQVCALGVRCLRDGAPAPCAAARVGAVRDAVVSSGKQLAADALADDLLAALLDARAVDVARARAAGRCLVVVQLSAELLEAGKPFTFVRTGARAVLYDSAAGKVTWSDEIAPGKVGHVSYEGAMNKGFDELQKTIAGRVTAALGGR